MRAAKILQSFPAKARIKAFVRGARWKESLMQQVAEKRSDKLLLHGGVCVCM